MHTLVSSPINRTARVFDLQTFPVIKGGATRFGEATLKDLLSVTRFIRRPLCTLIILSLSLTFVISNQLYSLFCLQLNCH